LTTGVDESALAGHLACQGVFYQFGPRTVLTDITFDLGVGVTGLLGPNGAGKSTLLDVLATVRRPRLGRTMVNGANPFEVGARGLDLARSQIGYLPQRFSLMMGATCQRNVAYAAWCNGVTARDAATAAMDSLSMVDLAAQAREPAAHLSGGQRQRLGLACAIAHRPAVLLLDEPTVGLDPAQRIELRRHLRRVAETSCVLLSTHIVDDLAQMASSVLVLSEGRIVFQGPVGALSRLAGDVRESLSSPLEAGYLSLLGSSRACPS
jgi:ABC-2 type transport system ATP-binding protein